MWGINLVSKAVSDFLPGGNGGLWGRTGAAVGSDGTVDAPTGDGEFNPPEHKFSESLIAVTGKDLKLKDYYSPSNSAFMWKRDLDMEVTPAVFNYKGKELLTTSSKECRIFLLDSQALGGADHRAPLLFNSLDLQRGSKFCECRCVGHMATWQDANGTRWCCLRSGGRAHPEFKAPASYGAVTHGAIVAFQVVDEGGKTILKPAWISRDMDLAEPPVIANGVGFAYASGENTVQATVEEGLSAVNTSAKRIANSTHATIYALDAQTGRELWSSGDQIKSFAHFFWIVGSQWPRLSGHLRRNLVFVRFAGGSKGPLMKRLIVFAIACAGLLHAQLGHTTDWFAYAGDAQHDGWERTNSDS